MRKLRKISTAKTFDNQREPTYSFEKTKWRKTPKSTKQSISKILETKKRIKENPYH